MPEAPRSRSFARLGSFPSLDERIDDFERRSVEPDHQNAGTLGSLCAAGKQEHGQDHEESPERRFASAPGESSSAPQRPHSVRWIFSPTHRPTATKRPGRESRYCPDNSIPKNCREREASED